MRPRHLLCAALCAFFLSLPAHARAAAPAGKLTWYGQSCFLLETAARHAHRHGSDPEGDRLRAAAGLEGGHRHDQPRALRPQQRRLRHGQATRPARPHRRQEGLDAHRREGEGRLDPQRRRLPRRPARGRARPRHRVHLRGGRRAHRAPRRSRATCSTTSSWPRSARSTCCWSPSAGRSPSTRLKATQVVEQLRPRIMVIPMHYKTDAVSIKELEPVAPFLDGKRNVRHETLEHDRAVADEGAPGRRDRPAQLPLTRGRRRAALPLAGHRIPADRPLADANRARSFRPRSSA